MVERWEGRMVEIEKRETIGILEAAIIINELTETKEEFKEKIRRIQVAIEKGVTEADQAKR